MATAFKDRIDVRISTEQKELVKYAAELRGFKSVSEFVVFCINAEATRIITDSEVILKTLEDKKIFVEAILNPPAPNDNLKKAQVRYNKKIGGGGSKY